MTRSRFSLLLLLSAGCSDSSTESQSNSLPPPQSVQPASDVATTTTPRELDDAAIETIAISDDSSAVYDAEEALRNRGIEALSALAAHMDDSRIPPGKVASLYQKTKGIETVPEMSDYCFWMIQEVILVDGFARVNREFSPFTKSTVAGWLDARKGMTQQELRRDAAVDIAKSMTEFLKTNPDDTEIEQLQEFYVRQIKMLDRVIEIGKQKDNDQE